MVIQTTSAMFVWIGSIVVGVKRRATKEREKGEEYMGKIVWRDEQR